MDLTDDATIRVCRRIKRIVFVMFRYPLFTRRYIRDNIEKPDTKPSELADYKSNCLDSKLYLTGLMMSIYMWNSVKNFYIVYLWLNSFNYSKHADNLRQLTQTDAQLVRMDYQLARDTLTRVACLITNCTRLSPPQGGPDGQHKQLLADVSHLPLFMMCNPEVDALYYTPVTRLGSFGLLAFAVTMYTHFLLGCWPTIQQMLRPTHDDMIMFISSPQVSRQILLRRSREFLHDLTSSYHNFCLSLLLATSGQRAPSKRPLMPSSMPSDISRDDPRQAAIETINPLIDSWIAAASLATNPSLGPKRQKQLESAESKCLPLIYTQWWRARAAQIMLNSLSFCLLGLVLIGISAITLVQSRLHSQAELLGQFDQEMRQMDCFIWPETSKFLNQERAFRLVDVDLHWTLFSFINAAALSIIAGTSILIMFSILWIELSTISVWVAEVRMLLVASLLATRQLYEHERRRANSELDRGHLKSSQKSGTPLINMRSFYDISNLRKNFQESINLLVFILYWRVKSGTESGERFVWRMLNSKRIDRDHATVLKAKILAMNSVENPRARRDALLMDECRTNYDIETLEQIYVNFRLLVEYIQRMRMVTGLVVVMSYLLNYGYLLLAIICWRKLATADIDTYFIAIFAISISSGLIFLCASFHSNAKRLQPLLYSLIAHLTYSNNLRLQHMRTLLIRLALMLDRAGGMSLNTYGHRITYVYIIQLIIGTATVVIMFLKQQA